LGAARVVVENVPAWTAVTVKVDGQGFKLSGAGMPPIPLKGPVQFEPLAPQDRMRVNNITRKGQIPQYRGVLEVTRATSSPLKLSVVNILPMSDYLKAVVPNELPPRYGMEAIKAQAVAARNYALRPRTKVWPQFDICDSQYCQVYFGSHTETSQTNAALEKTDGLVALYKGELVLALYSSSHGGYGEAYSNAFSDPDTKQFPAPPLAYLPGAPDIPSADYGDLRHEENARKFWTTRAPSFDVNSPHYRWEKTWTRAQLEAQLNQTLAEVSKTGMTKDFITPLFQPGQKIGTLKRVNVLQRGVSGKAMVVQIEATGGTWTIKKEYVIRKVFAQGGRMLPSANIVFSHLTGAGGRLESLKVNGGGFGHGVGMSQLGASYMSGHGHTFDEIIQHYYKGAALGTLPLTMGEGHEALPIHTSFYGYKPTGILYVQTTEPDPTKAGPIRMLINDRPVRALPTREQPTAYDVSALLHAGEHNTLTLFPDEKNPQRKLRAWIEVVPPKTAEAR
ncbi:MAG: SpoIID/LytB domain-containing protein, partial [Candidatus Melainabacteria bacterium]